MNGADGGNLTVGEGTGVAISKRADRTSELAVVDGRAWRVVRDSRNPLVTEAFPHGGGVGPDVARGLDEALARLLVGEWLRRQKGRSDG